MSDPVVRPLDVARVQQLLRGSRLGLPLHYREVTESTNDDAACLGRAGASEGSTVIADAQTRGRGRRGRVWVSPPHVNIYVSVLLRPRIDVQHCPQIAIAAGLAALSAIRAVVPVAQLKWPNDVLVRGRKLCGILAEMSARPDRVLDFVVVGIGVNVNSVEADFPAELRKMATSLRIECGTAVDREAFVAALLRQFGEEYERFLRSGFGPVRQRWEETCATIGQAVEVEMGVERFLGTAIGLDEHGCLRVRRVDGQEVEVTSGEVWLREPTTPVH